MKLRSIARCAVLLGIGACGNATGPGDVAGQYDLKRLDGDVLPSCCNSQADSGRIVAGELQIGGSVGDDRYRWRITRADIHADTTRITSFVFSAGQYEWYGQVLTLRDSTGLGRMAGVTSGDAILVATEDHHYEFVRRRPPSIVGQYAMLGCWDAEGGSPGCSETDSAGTVVTIVAGGLQLGFNTPLGTYKWDVTRKYEHSDGTSELVGSWFSTGKYAWDGETLRLVDDFRNLAPMTGTLSGGIITVKTQDHQYKFLKLVQLPSR